MLTYILKRYKMSHFVREPAKNSDKGIMSEQFCLAVTEQKNVYFPQLSGSAASFYFPSFLFRVITPRPFNKNTFPSLFGIILFHVLCTVYIAWNYGLNWLYMRPSLTAGRLLRGIFLPKFAPTQNGTLFNLKHNCTRTLLVLTSVADPDPHGSGTFAC